MDTGDVHIVRSLFLNRLPGYDSRARSYCCGIDGTSLGDSPRPRSHRQGARWLCGPPRQRCAHTPRTAGWWTRTRACTYATRWCCTVALGACAHASAYGVAWGLACVALHQTVKYGLQYDDHDEPVDEVAQCHGSSMMMRHTSAPMMPTRAHW